MALVATFEYPLFVPRATDPIPAGPGPYLRDDVDADVVYFRESATPDEWARYRRWILEQEESRRPFLATAAVAHKEIIENCHLFTLRRGIFITDNILNYALKSMSAALGLQDEPVVFFPSYFFTELCQHGHLHGSSNYSAFGQDEGF